MDINPFGGVKDYTGDMLAKIATFTFFGAIPGVMLLRHHFSMIDSVLANLTFNLRVVEVDISGGTVLAALLVALVTRIIKLHDCVSYVLRIRRRFTIYRIFLPMATMCGASLTRSQIDKMHVEWVTLRNKIFYKYASSGEGAAKIDVHLIRTALDQWCWYWIVVEWSTLALVLAAACLSTGHAVSAAWLLAGVLTGAAAARALSGYCARYALDEVEAITDDAGRRREIEDTLRAL